MSRFSKAQIALLRHRLKAYRDRNPGEGRACLSWEEVSMDVADVTGIAVPPERLRQFVEGASRKIGRGPSLLSPERLCAVRDFLRHEEIGEIHEREWTARPKKGHATLLVYMPLDEFLRKQEEGFFAGLEFEPLEMPRPNPEAEWPDQT
ncbi:MAG: hypothetical protein IT557_17415 [Alphaproteobacteria bacterium]|nr:hypothetical protein [Alphaproteobacteria bacterium]